MTLAQCIKLLKLRYYCYKMLAHCNVICSEVQNDWTLYMKLYTLFLGGVKERI